MFNFTTTTSRTNNKIDGASNREERTKLLLAQHIKARANTVRDFNERSMNNIVKFLHNQRFIRTHWKKNIPHTDKMGLAGKQEDHFLQQINTQQINNVINNTEEDIAIIACYPQYLNTYYWIHYLINKIKFHKIYLIYSESEINPINVNLLDKIKNIASNKIKIIKIINNGLDFGKYFEGMKSVIANRENFKKIWLINDSFFIDDIDSLIKQYSKIYDEKIIGCFLSNEYKSHLQSYFLILDKDIFYSYFLVLKDYQFKNISNLSQKVQLIHDLEINLNNKIIQNNKFATIYLGRNDNLNPCHTPNSINNGLIKGDVFNKLKKEIKNEETWRKKMKDSFVDRYNKSYQIYTILYEFIFTKEVLQIYSHFYQKSTLETYTIPYINNKIIRSIQIINFFKQYTSNNYHANLLKNVFFDYNCVNFTNKEHLKESVKNIQKITQNKKLVYTSNVYQYDTFFDIDDKFIESDVDYIYVSNCLDADVCKNFKHIYSNIEGLDEFEFNRMIKFDKTLFDCYEKVLYIDSNVTIHKKLGDFWDKLDGNTDLVLFSHPDRNTVIEEIYTLKNCTENHNKWNLNSNKVNELCENFKDNLNNDLFWLNVQLSTTKMNIYQEIEEMYEKYKLKRDQVYFSLIKNKNKIKTIKIAPCKSDLGKFFQKSQIKHKCVDGDYNYLVNWSDKFSRPFGGAHL